MHGYAKSQGMQIVKQKADIKEHYADVFKGVGCFPGPPYHIQVDPKVPPKQTPVRPVSCPSERSFQARIGQNVTCRLYQTCK